MDTHISGIIRWLNALGITTTLSCEGHKPDAPCWLELADNAEAPRVAELLERLSNGRISYANEHIFVKDSANPRKERRPSGPELLDLGEAIFEESRKISRGAHRANL